MSSFVEESKPERRLLPTGMKDHTSWADTRVMGIDFLTYRRVTKGLTAEQRGFLFTVLCNAYMNQTYPPDDLSGLSANEIRKAFDCDPRMVRRLWNPEIRSALSTCMRANIRPPLAKGAREFVYEREEGRCHHCGAPIAFNAFEVDHLIPVALGGLTRADNIVASCMPCNRKKGAAL